jgi:uncharacterized protein (TIGR00730 family)
VCSLLLLLNRVEFMPTRKNPIKDRKKTKTNKKPFSARRGGRKRVVSPSSVSMGTGSRGERRKHLDERLRLLHHRTMLIEQELRKLDNDRFYRVCIFGSARIKADSKAYTDVFTLARFFGWEGIDVLTGGGPGLMEAANKGATLGREEKQTKSLSYGLSIQLEFEPEPNMHLDIKRHHYRFSARLDDFMRLSHSVVCTPGGIGTLLEFYFVWQLIQVKHAPPRPIVLLDKAYWEGLVNWMRDVPLKRALVSEKDFSFLHIVDTPEEVFEVISKHHQEFRNRSLRRKDPT